MKASLSSFSRTTLLSTYLHKGSMRAVFRQLSLFLTIFSIGIASVYAEPNSAFLRLGRSETGVVQTLETSIVRYVKGDLSVDLVGAVHIGDRSYFAALNKQFESYDAVLYELIAPVDHDRQLQRSGPENPVSFLQVSLQNILELEYQLSSIDYTKSNFIHADMSPEQFVESMSRRGENFLSMFLKMFVKLYLKEMEKPQAASNIPFLLALMSKDKARALKVVMAEQFEDLDTLSEMINGPGGSTIIGDRNDVALSVLEKTISRGKKRIAIFYGAAHLPDFDRKLRTRFGMRPDSPQWLVAWDMRHNRQIVDETASALLK